MGYPYAPDLNLLGKWKNAFAVGRARRRVLFNMRLEDGERFGISETPWAMGATTIGRAPFVQTQAAVPMEKGIVYATDRRLVVGQGRRVYRELRWTDVRDVQVAQGSPGDPIVGAVVLPMRYPETGECAEVFMTTWSAKATYASPNLDRRTQNWYKVQGCFWASHGLLDQWFEGLRSGQPLQAPPYPTT